MKASPFLDMDHLYNLRYVSSKVPGTPAPQCLGALRSSHRTYLFLSRAPGVTLESVCSDLTNAHKLSVQRQLNGIFARLRAENFGARLVVVVRTRPASEASRRVSARTRGAISA